MLAVLRHQLEMLSIYLEVFWTCFNRNGYRTQFTIPSEKKTCRFESGIWDAVNYTSILEFLLLDVHYLTTDFIIVEHC